MPLDLDYVQSLESSNPLHKPFLYVGSSLNVDSQSNRCFWSELDISNYWRGPILPVCIVISRSSISFLSSIMILSSYASFPSNDENPLWKIIIVLFLYYCPSMGLSFKIWGIFSWRWQAINDDDVRNVVLSYLVHNCFNETVDSFVACTGMKQPADYIEDLEKRKSKWNYSFGRESRIQSF